MKTLGLGFLFVLALVPLNGWAGLSLTLKTSVQSQLHAGDQEKLRDFVDQIDRLLPSEIRDRLQPQIEIEFTDWSGAGAFEIPSCNSSSEIPGKTTKKKPLSRMVSPRLLQISSQLIPEILKGPDASSRFTCGHRTVYRLAMATVIQELGHLIDALNGISSEKYFKRLIGWKIKSSLTKGYLRKPKPKSTISVRSPDDQENQSISEFFSINLAYFLLDPEYPCRRPSLNGYFEKIFAFSRPVECRVQTRVPVRNPLFKSDSSQSPWLDLSPDRIYAVHLLHAEPGSALASRWGHTLFRLVGCAPGRVVGPDCLKDVSYHTVVSFSAVIGEADSGIWKGLTGGYRSQVFLTSLKETVENYTQNEFRGLKGFPLRLTSGEKTLFISRMLELLWGYQSPYYFFSNNCKTESGELLKGVLNIPGSKWFNPLTPGQLLEGLLKWGLLVSQALDVTSATFNANSFESRRPLLEKAFEQVSSYALDHQLGGSFPWRNLADYFNRSGPEERHVAFHAFTDAPRRILSSFALLENFIQFKKDRKLNHDAYKSLETSSHSLYQEIRLELENGLLIHQPKRGYGIPTLEDFDQFPPATDLSKGLRQKFEIWKTLTFEVEQSELEQIRSNIRFLDPLLFNS